MVIGKSGLSKVRSLTAAIVAVAAAGLTGATQAGASVIYNTWTSNGQYGGNYILTITDSGATNLFNWNLTISPWNAEALGLFVDLGGASTSIGTPSSVALTNVTPIGKVSVYATDTASDTCGNGCNLNGLAVPALAGGDWELVFRLGAQGYEGIQTFSWTTPDFGLTESAFGVVGVRAQQLCAPGGTLPAGNCGSSDKSFGYGTIDGGSRPTGVPLPGTLALLGAGLFGFGLSSRRASCHTA